MSIIGTQMSSAVSFLTERLKIEQPASTDSALSSVAPNTDATTVDTEASYLLMLKDRIELGGYIYTSVSMKQQHMEELSGYLLQLRDVAIELQSYTQGTGEYDDAIARSQVIENDMSEFIGSVVHGQDLTPSAVFSKEQTMHSFLDFVDVNTGDENINQQVAAIEVDLISLFSNLHNPAVCVHCAEAAAANSQQTNSISGVLEPYASTAYNDSTAGAVAAPNTADATLEPLRMGEMWDVGDGDTLSYSYYEGAVAYDPNYNGNTGTPGTPSGIEAAGTGNSAALDEAFTAWDEAVAFDFEKVVESGTTVGELRVAFTDEGTTGGRAAFAYGPGSTYTINGQSYIDSFSTNGDIYFETADINTNGGAVDFDASGVGNTGFNFFTALHEIGHALGLSHPFDGGSDTGATLALSLDNMRQTVMTYVQTDRNVAFSINDNGNGTFSAATERIYSSTPGMLDFEMMGELYGTETDSSVTEGDNTYSFGANLQTIKTIADSGGTDTIDASAQTRNSTINLSAGAFSSIGIYTEAEQKTYWANQTGLTEAQIQNWFDVFDAQASAANAYYSQYQRSAIYTGADNVGISKTSEIENAIGGSGDDTITGNDLANTLTGNGGNDNIDGGSGDDIAIYNGAMSDYTITNNSGVITITDNAGTDGTDTLTNIEHIQFTSGASTVYYSTATGNTSSIQPTGSSGQSSSSSGGSLGGSSNRGAGKSPVYGGAVSGIDLTTMHGAQAAISVVDGALEQVNTMRSKFGTIMNRLGYTINSLSSQSLNTQASLGRIVDADMAVEVSKLIKTRLLSESAQHIISRSWLHEKGALSLIR